MDTSVINATEYRNLPLGLLTESTTNPRRIFEEDSLKELAESIRTQGILSPLLVRPLNERGFEIVAGARRYRAAQMAEAATVPVRIINLSDAEALEAQLIENLQRRDVHPMEEAQGFKALLDLDEPKYSIEQIAAKTGKSAVYVAQRLKLTELAPVAVEAFYREEIGVGHALLLAKLPADRQEEALSACFREDWSATSDRKAKRILLPVRNLQFWIESNIMLILKDAPFDKRDAHLVAIAGSCVDCPKRTGHNKLLFAEVRQDACTDPSCYQAKVDAHVADVLNATEDSLLEIAGHLPVEAAEALLNLATGIRPPLPEVSPAGGNPFEHPDALRRFRVMKNVEDLALALDYPWERWAVFLHPEQRKLVEKRFNGPARVSGTAGTGKTIVALHRAAHLARTNLQARILLTTFSEPLANALRAKLRLLLSSEPRLGERIEVYAMDAIGRRLYELNLGKLRIVSSSAMSDLVEQASQVVGGHKFSLRFRTTEWEQVVDGWQLESWEDYRDVVRLGRKTRLKEPQRQLLWSIFEKVRAGLREQGLLTTSGMFNVLARHYANGAAPPFDFTVVDEAQDISIAQIRFLAAIGAGRPNGLFFAGDLGQRIFQQPFSWKAAGVDVRGRSTSLKINYRTSHQIRSQADRLLEPQISDVDGNLEERKGTVSLFNGPKPDIKTYQSNDGEVDGVSAWLTQLTKEGIQPHEIALFVRSASQLDRPKAAVEQAELKYRLLDEHVEVTPGSVSVSTMHLAKGLEFRAVGVMACDDEVIPLQERIETVTDESDLEDVYNTERHLLYVACTRARDHLLVTSTEPGSEFLEDMQ